MTQQDHEEFSEYLQQKGASEREQDLQPVEAHESQPSKVSRRRMLTWAAGTAVAAEAAVLGHSLVSGQSTSQAQQQSAAVPAQPQRNAIDRQLVNPQADIGGRRFGNWVLLMPTKLAGGAYAVNCDTGRALAWISYWTYGDYNPISHHLCAFPSSDPTRGFEWINSTHGRQELFDLRNSHQDRDAGRRLQYLPCPL